jgi:membrane associated rhomboid family serine protease
MAHHRVSDETPLFTYAMAAALIAVFAAQGTNSDVTRLLSFPWRLGSGEIWRLVTCTLVHGSILHFVFNFAMFLRFSTAIERWLGPWVAMLMYILFALPSAAAESLWSGNVVVGASGVVYGMFGFLWVTRRRYDIAAEVVTPYMIQLMLGWLVVGFVVGMFGAPLGNVAHLIGMACGWLLGQAVIANRRRRIPLILATAALTILLVVCVWKPAYDRTLAHIPWLTWQYQYQINRPEIEWPVREQRYYPFNPLRQVI